MNCWAFFISSFSSFLCSALAAKSRRSVRKVSHWSNHEQLQLMFSEEHRSICRSVGRRFALNNSVTSEHKTNVCRVGSGLREAGRLLLGPWHHDAGISSLRQVSVQKTKLIDKYIKLDYYPLPMIQIYFINHALTVCPGSSYPNLYNELLYELG